jgi:hypothetical protein
MNPPPGAGGAYVLLLILKRRGARPTLAAWHGVPVIAAGVVLNAWRVRAFAVNRKGNAGPRGAPRRVVAARPDWWVRNPIDIAAGDAPGVAPDDRAVAGARRAAAIGQRPCGRHPAVDEPRGPVAGR